MRTSFKVSLCLSQQGVEFSRAQISRDLLIPRLSIKLGEPLTELCKPTGRERSHGLFDGFDVRHVAPPLFERSFQILPNRHAWQAQSLTQSPLSIQFLATGNMTESHRPVAALPLGAEGLNRLMPLAQTQQATVLGEARARLDLQGRLGLISTLAPVARGLKARMTSSCSTWVRETCCE